MGRGKKSIITESDIDRRLSGYYSTPEFVSEFIASELLRVSPNGNRVLDPCVGKEEMLTLFKVQRKDIDSIDISDYGIKHDSNFIQKDFLEFYEEQKSLSTKGVEINLDYDYYILNPPYNCHEVDYIRDNKTRLKKLFPEVGVHNTYSMFLSAIIDCAKEGAVIGVITLDSFLTSKTHYQLRKQIYDQCSVHTLLLCPTDLFWHQKADVRTCIMILQKGKKFQGKIFTANRPKDTPSFKEILNKRLFDSTQLFEVVLNSSNDLDEFVIGCPKEIWTLFSAPRLGETFRCVTGISTADDKKYLSSVKKEGFNVPFYKNPGTKRFYTEPNAYLTDDFLSLDKKISNFQVRNKDILFKEGITCSSMGVPFTTCYLPANSTFGVNANIICESNDIWWLIAYLNSSLVTYLVRGILLRGNMITSGYVSRIPIAPISSEAKKIIASIALTIYENKGNNSEQSVKDIDRVIFSDLKLNAKIEEFITKFCADLLRNT